MSSIRKKLSDAGGINGSGTGTGNGGSSSVDCSQCSGTGNIDLDAINDYIAGDDKWFDFNNNGNKVTLIPFTHINGWSAEWDFFALVNFEYKTKTSPKFVKYQVTYLSCTCRDKSVNFWQTAYVELSIPASGNADDIKLQYLSYDVESGDHYTAGFWGDSGTLHPIDNSAYDVTYEDIKTAFIPYLVGKTKAELSPLSVTSDIDAADFASDMAGTMFHGEQVTLDHFYGASVSTNNMIRVVNSLMDYHAARYL